MAASDIFQIMIFKAVHLDNFKGGVFKSQISKATLVSDALKVLINSTYTTNEEKDVMKDFRNKFIAAIGDRNDAKPCLITELALVSAMEQLEGIFINDARSQGIDGDVIKAMYGTNRDDGKRR